ncbi:hypothetical protein QR680_018247 [Steinernema hermaphroditum]|uniref:Anaphase-promoting complex subunit 4 WD40 domain-containing protein n=1 Tax=Steinernema hermaphroditum TaxID=289476 RepID=A0AA39HHB8_9BILA|nr:hypothetical protein QR680_018247 [Steinernema hermaphroditum]
MYVYLTRKISMPANKTLQCVSYMQNKGYVAAGGMDGLLKVFKMIDHPLIKGSARDMKNVALPGTTNLETNQSLEGHSGIVNIVAWNEIYQKLTTSDSNGLIIVWMIHQDQWYEEMINNRNKSTVVDMAWSYDGQRIAIAYEDGQVIVGSCDGNRLWSKEINGNLAKVCWSPDSTLLLFGMVDGEVHAYNANGDHVLKVPMACLDNVELESALAIFVEDLRKDSIVSMEYYVPPYEEPKEGHLGANQEPAFAREDGANAVRPVVGDDRNRLLVAYQHGVVQLMRHESDQNQVVCRLNMVISQACWSPCGFMIAVAGHQTDLPDTERNVLTFLNAYGQKIRTLRVPGTSLTSCSWDGSGLRLALAIDNHVYFASVRPNYKFTYCGQTLVYSYERRDLIDHVVVFYETKMEEVYRKYVRNLMAMTAHDQYCVLANKGDEVAGVESVSYQFQICNGIGTPVDYKYIELEPKHLAMNSKSVLIASNDRFSIWNYTVPRKTKMEFASLFKAENTVESNDTIYHIDNGPERGGFDVKPFHRPTSDYITSVCMNENFFLVCRNSGTILKFTLPSCQCVSKFSIQSAAEHMMLNCNSSQLAVLTPSTSIRLYELEEKAAKLKFERKDVWTAMWDSENPNTIAIMEKSRMIVIRGSELEEPVNNNGYFCSFKDLTVRTAVLDDILKEPENPKKDHITDMEIKSLRDAKALLSKMKIEEANAYIEKNSHPKLWSLLAEVALTRLDLATAEHAFVRLQDYAGIQFLKKLKNVQIDKLKKAEVCLFLGKVDEAEKIYMDNDRRDLAIEMRKKLKDWFRILQIIQQSTGPGDDVLRLEAWERVGDYFADRQKWDVAAKHYEMSRSYKELSDCYIMLEDYNALEQLAKQINDGNELLARIGKVFANTGLCEQAVDCYMRCDRINEALDICIQLNQWEKAVELSRQHNLRDVQSLLGKHAEQLTGSIDKQLAAVQLFRRAGRYIDAAKIVFNIANQERMKQSQPVRLKKLYVMGALLVEQYREQNKAKLAKGQEGKKDMTGAEIALQGLLAEDSSLSIEDSKMIDGAWRGAEAYHFFMLTHRQMYDGDVDAAMKTALSVVEYEDILDTLEIYSLLALSACAARQFYVCSRAFMKLESIPTQSPDEREVYERLARTIFMKHMPLDARLKQVECPQCDTMIPDYSLACPSCDTKFPVCIVSGRPLFDYQFWLCPSCKHRAYEKEIQGHKHCPLCHHELSQ